MPRILLIALALAVLAVLVVTLWPDGPPADSAASPRAAAPAPPAAPGPRAEVAPPAPGNPAAAGLVRAPASARRDVGAAPEPEPEPGASGWREITGQVVDELGRGLGAAEVQIGPAQDRRHLFGPDSASSWTASTDDAGHFALSVGELKQISVEVRAAGYVTSKIEHPWPPAGHERTGKPFDLGQIVLVPGTFLAGRVIDEVGAPVAAAAIHRIAPGNGSSFFFGRGEERGELLAVSAGDGSFRIDGLALGPWHLLVLSPEHPEQEFEGVVEAGGSPQLLLELRGGRSISGRVIAEDDTPLETVRVRALPAAGIEVDTLVGARPWRDAACAADGSFRIGGLPDVEDPYVLRALVGDDYIFSTDWRSAAVEARVGQRSVELRLQVALKLTFRAVDATNGAPLDAYELTVVHAQDGDEESDYLSADDEERVSRAASGVTTVRGVRPPAPSSLTSLVLSRDGYESIASPPAALFGAREHDFGTLALTPVASVSVLVMDALTSAPVAGAAVSLELEEDSEEYTVGPDGRVTIGLRENHEALTGADGIARLARIENRAFALGVRHPRYAPAADIELVLRPGERTGTPGFEFALLRGGRVDVAVVGPGGEPAPGFKVVASTTGWSMKRPSDADGRASFKALRPGFYRFSVRSLDRRSVFPSGEEDAPPLGPHSAELQVLDGGKHALTLTRPALGELSGRVTEGGRPLTGAVCRAEQEGSLHIPGLTDLPEARTDRDGRYRLAQVPGGPHRIVVSHAARAMDRSVPLEIEEGQNTLDIELPLTSIAGTVSGPDGRPLPGVSVRVESVDGPEKRSSLSIRFSAGDGINVNLFGDETPGTETDEDGAFALRGVHARTALRVSAEHPDYLSAEVSPIELDPDQALEGVRLALGAAGRLLVTVPGAGEGQITVGGDFVAPEDWEGGTVDGTGGQTDARGQVLLRGLAPGTWQVVAQDTEDNQSSPRMAVVTADATAELTIHVP